MFLNALKKETNFTLTANGAVAHKSTLNKLMDLFAMGAAYRWRDDSDCIALSALKAHLLITIFLSLPDRS